jgi:hypothetical protein
MPLIWASVSGGQATAAVSIRTRALTRSGAQGRAKRQEAALGVPGQSRLSGTEVVKQAEQIVGRVPVRVRAAVVLGAPVQPLVPGHAPELATQRLDLRCPHVAVHQVAVTEYDDRAVASGVLEIQLLTIH